MWEAAAVMCARAAGPCTRGCHGCNARPPPLPSPTCSHKLGTYGPQAARALDDDRALAVEWRVLALVLVLQRLELLLEFLLQRVRRLLQLLQLHHALAHRLRSRGVGRAYRGRCGGRGGGGLGGGLGGGCGGDAEVCCCGSTRSRRGPARRGVAKLEARRVPAAAQPPSGRGAARRSC